MVKDHEQDKEYLKEVETTKMSKGRKELLEYLKTGNITLRGAVFAKCFDCCGFYEDGKEDCGDYLCPLYPFMPFNKSKKPARRVISDEHKKKMAEGRSKLTKK